MAGQIHPVAPRQTYTFSMASGTSSVLVLAREINVVGMREAQLLIRAHKDMTVTGTAPTVEVRVHAVSPSPDEPQLEFVVGGPANPTSLATQALTSGTALQGTLFLKNVDLSGAILNSFGTHLRIVLVVTGTGTGAVTDLTLSVDLVAKS